MKTPLFRVHRWIATAWAQRHAAACPAPVLPLPDMDVIRHAMQVVIVPCSADHRGRALRQITGARSVLELWLLRSDLYQYLAQDLGQSEAASRVAALLPLFNGAVPTAAARPGIPDNGGHGQHLH